MAEFYAGNPCIIVDKPLRLQRVFHSIRFKVNERLVARDG